MSVPNYHGTTTRAPPIQKSNCGIEETSCSDAGRVCKEHFETKIFSASSELVPDAIPNLFDNGLPRKRKFQDGQLSAHIQTNKQFKSATEICASKNVNTENNKLLISGLNSKTCAVPMCTSSKRRNEKNMIFFRFPMDDRFRADWIKRCGLESVQKEFFAGQKGPRICEKHFEKKMFVNESCLFQDAVPTIFDVEPMVHVTLENTQVALEIKTEPVNIDFPDLQKTLEHSSNFVLDNVKFEHPDNSEDVKSTEIREHFSEKQLDTFNSLPLKTELDDFKMPTNCNFENQLKNDTFTNSVIHLKMDSTSQEPSYSYSSNIHYEEKSTPAPNDSIKKNLTGNFYPETEEVKQLLSIREKLQAELELKQKSMLYLRLAEKYLPPDLFEKVKSHIENVRSVFGDF